MKLKQIKLYSISILAALSVAGCYNNTNYNDRPDIDNVVVHKTDGSTAYYDSNNKITVKKDHNRRHKAIKTDIVLADPNYNSANDPYTVKASVINGTWKLSIDDEVCQLITSHTKLGKNYRASVRSCPAELKDIRSWQTKEDKLHLYDDHNNLVLSLSLDKEDNNSDEVKDPNSGETYHQPVVIKLIGTTKEGKTVKMYR